MTKNLLLMLAAVFALAGCVAVPVYESPPPAYGYYYGAPAASVTFGYYGQGHRHYYRDRHYDYRR